MSDITASYPLVVKIFQTLVDEITTIDAADINEIHDEIVAIETTLGLSPYTGTPYTNLAEALTDLYNTKADSDHDHDHSDLLGLDNPVAHPQYSLIDGSVPFTGPVSGVPAVAGNQLATLGQVQGLGFVDGSYVAGQLDALTQNLVRAVAGSNSPIFGTFDPANAKLAFGLVSGTTGPSGGLNATLSGFTEGVLAVVVTRIAGMTQPGAVPQLGAVTLSSAAVNFYDVDGNGVAFASASYSFIALGS